MSNYYEVLGVAHGASAQELKAAYRDLAKVWHPDRFAHDARLQEKAQEKLKLINEAYEQLTSGNARFHQPTASTDQPYPQRKASRARWQHVALPLCVFMVVLLISGSLLIARREPPTQNPAQEVESSEVAQPLLERASDSVKEPQRVGKKISSRQLPAEATQEPIVERAALTTVKPLPTVTLVIDPTSGLIATTHCPIKSRMTYADGNAPRQYCSLHQSGTRAAADQPAKESRLKTLSKRLASPAKWFRGKEKSGSAQQETPVARDTGNPD